MFRWLSANPVPGASVSTTRKSAAICHSLDRTNAANLCLMHASCGGVAVAVMIPPTILVEALPLAKMGYGAKKDITNRFCVHAGLQVGRFAKGGFDIHINWSRRTLVVLLGQWA